jgi:hypothetical protein
MCNSRGFYTPGRQRIRVRRPPRGRVKAPPRHRPHTPIESEAEPKRSARSGGARCRRAVPQHLATSRELEAQTPAPNRTGNGTGRGAFPYLVDFNSIGAGRARIDPLDRGLESRRDPERIKPRRPGYPVSNGGDVASENERADRQEVDQQAGCVLDDGADWAAAERGV